MTKTVKTALIILSVSLNVAFIGAWAVMVAPSLVTGDSPAINRTEGSRDVHPANGERKLFYHHLDLTEEQITKLQERCSDFRKKMRKLRSDIGEKRKSLLQLLQERESNKKEISTLQSEIFSRQKKIQLSTSSRENLRSISFCF